MVSVLCLTLPDPYFSFMDSSLANSVISQPWEFSGCLHQAQEQHLIKASLSKPVLNQCQVALAHTVVIAVFSGDLNPLIKSSSSLALGSTAAED